mmetsp:Transcript_100654/g.239974  ORF Transcript_100654/g.239974 Transcript_100654/m.239974 type:complete len:294 (+) Transcript_100654:327-1208(+)
MRDVSNARAGPVGRMSTIQVAPVSIQSVARFVVAIPRVNFNGSILVAGVHDGQVIAARISESELADLYPPVSETDAHGSSLGAVQGVPVTARAPCLSPIVSQDHGGPPVSCVRDREVSVIDGPEAEFADLDKLEAELNLCARPPRPARGIVSMPVTAVTAPSVPVFLPDHSDLPRVLVRDRQVSVVKLGNAKLAKLNEAVAHFQTLWASRGAVLSVHSRLVNLFRWHNLDLRLICRPLAGGSTPELICAGSVLETRRRPHLLAKELLRLQNVDRLEVPLETEVGDKACQKVPR